MSNSKRHHIAVDIGNSSIKIGVSACRSQDWASLWHGQIAELDPNLLPLLPTGTASWWICSVNQPSLGELQKWLKTNRANDLFHVISRHDIPMEVSVESPDRVGVDRLVAAYGASLRHPDRDLVVVDAGTAVTVDAVAEGKFIGGTISPGSRIEFEALLSQADQLPLIDGSEIPENVIGKSTEAAIRSGVLFGQVGSLTFLAAEIAKQLSDPTVIATGGGATQLQKLLPCSWEFAPTLVLDGIRTLANESKSKSEQ